MKHPPVPEIIRQISDGIDAANREIAGNFSIKKIHCVPSFLIEKDRQLAVWIFHYKDADTEKMTSSRNNIENAVKRVLLRHRVSEDILEKIVWVYDSDENVQKNYEGSYFYRLR